MPAYTGPTPYDAEISKLGKDDPPDTWIALPRLEAKAEGYRRAKSEDAPLLEALKHWRKLWNLRPLDSGQDMQDLLKECFNVGEAAIAAYQGKE